jgi:hypothetical protein
MTPKIPAHSMYHGNVFQFRIFSPPRMKRNIPEKIMPLIWMIKLLAMPPTFCPMAPAMGD